MLLSQAAKTGRKFRRSTEPDRWYYLKGKTICRQAREPNPDGVSEGWSPNAEELIASDWEAEPKVISVSQKDLLEVARTLSNHPITNQRKLAPVEFMKLVIEELGLEEEL